MAKNKALREANRNKKDEFYTQLHDIEKELRFYKNHFKDKVVYCNCDDPRVSNFFKYFYLNFEYLGLKKLITTCYKNQDIDLFSENEVEEAVWIEYSGEGNIENFDNIKVNELKGDGDFRSKECIELLEEADIVVTNPPFSLFREYVAQLMEYNKSFLIIGNQNAITYKEIFSLIKKNMLWLGNNVGDMEFEVPEHYEARATRYREDERGRKYRSMGNICWFTNLDIEKRHQDLILYKKYTEEIYDTFDNYDAINVDKVADIPCDYYENMGVPITFLDKYNPSQFEIIDGLNRYSILEGPTEKTRGKYMTEINGKPKYVRIVIKRRR